MLQYRNKNSFVPIPRTDQMVQRIRVDKQVDY